MVLTNETDGDLIMSELSEKEANIIKDHRLKTFTEILNLLESVRGDRPAVEEDRLGAIRHVRSALRTMRVT